MKTAEVLDMIQILKETGFKHIDVAHEGSHIILSNSEYIGQKDHHVGQSPMYQAITPQVQGPQVDSFDQIESENKEQAIGVKGGHIVESPIVGTYYNAPSPDSAPYITVGSKVKKGDVLCIIEAMKLMNEIEADQDGEIAEILVENEQSVEYGQALFRIV